MFLALLDLLRKYVFGDGEETLGVSGLDLEGR